MNLQMIDLSVLVNRASRRALLQAGKVVIVAAASSVEEDSANFLFVVKVKSWSMRAARSAHGPFLKCLILS